jgi:membrane protease subunit HflK
VAWNKQTGGWKGNGGGPWGQGPRNTGGGNSNPSDLEELLRRSQDRLRRVFPGGGGGWFRGSNPLAVGLIGLLLVVAVGYVLWSQFTFTVQSQGGEVGVVLQFGKYNRTEGTGLHFKWPYPIETVYTPQIANQRQVTVGTTTDPRNPTVPGKDIPAESLMLTGDENIVDINFTVFWDIDTLQNAQNYLFNMVDPDGTVKAAAESAMREVVGQSNIQDLLTQGRQVTEQKTLDLLQKTMDEYGAGVSIQHVQLLKVDPPDEVVAAFRDVQAAQADQVRLQNEAQTYANQVVPTAQGQAAQIVQAATAYHDRVIAEAKGQAEAFNSVYESYKTAPEVTRERMYLEAMEQVLSGRDKIILDQGAGGTSGSSILPYLPLSALQPPPAAGAPSGPATPGPATSGFFATPTTTPSVTR